MLLDILVPPRDDSSTGGMIVAWTILIVIFVALAALLIVQTINGMQKAKARATQQRRFAEGLVLAQAMQPAVREHRALPGTPEYDEEFQRMRKLVLARDGYACVQCGYSANVDVHHKIPRAEGGSNEGSNLETLCPNHHRLAHRNRVVAKRRH